MRQMCWVRDRRRGRRLGADTPSTERHLFRRRPSNLPTQPLPTAGARAARGVAAAALGPAPPRGGDCPAGRRPPWCRRLCCHAPWPRAHPACNQPVGHGMAGFKGGATSGGQLVISAAGQVACIGGSGLTAALVPQRPEAATGARPPTRLVDSRPAPCTHPALADQPHTHTTTHNPTSTPALTCMSTQPYTPTHPTPPHITPPPTPTHPHPPV